MVLVPRQLRRYNYRGIWSMTSSNKQSTWSRCPSVGVGGRRRCPRVWYYLLSPNNDNTYGSKPIPTDYVVVVVAWMNIDWMRMNLTFALKMESGSSVPLSAHACYGTRVISCWKRQHRRPSSHNRHHPLRWPK